MKIVAATLDQAQEMVNRFNVYSELEIKNDGLEIEVDEVELDILIDALAFTGFDLNVVEALGNALDDNLFLIAL
ncbi:hypothetical protein CPT_Moby_237 [Stenotrophomonas phage Moby]|uniref:Uncharacterized protein n=1 Tax=Stenotrophomonas phage Moby TaxID=2601680 RepID=A0A5P8PMQ8_9CAUD|nr:hypothetical protein HWC58_gp161 [Stenotrophomonas phage Moby]QFR57962.1 hypothetical protein CPT_Moby_237 [Stenotrophomonas phage Moby]